MNASLCGINLFVTAVNRQREKRLQEERLRRVKTLGEAAPDVDDVAAWVGKSRVLEEKAKAEARAKALKQARALEEQVRLIFTISVCMWTCTINFRRIRPHGLA